MIVAFSYIATGLGRVHSPYIAVWVENASGHLVRTVSLWYKSDERKYLSDLRRWNGADGRGTNAVMSGATRVPGSYTVAWDAIDSSGSPVPSGDYHLCIEAAREDGPYELIRHPITLDGTPFVQSMPDDGELTNATVEFRV